MSGLRDHLQAIYDQRGALTPRLVVDEARADEHPLHASFEWDDSIAGEAWRIEQARHLIQAIKIVYRPATGRNPERTIRAWQSVRREDGYGYEPSEVVALDPVQYRIRLMDMAREWKEFKARYDHFAEFVAMVRADIAS